MFVCVKSGYVLVLCLCVSTRSVFAFRAKCAVSVSASVGGRCVLGANFPVSLLASAYRCHEYAQYAQSHDVILAKIRAARGRRRWRDTHLAEDYRCCALALRINDLVHVMHLLQKQGGGETSGSSESNTIACITSNVDANSNIARTLGNVDASLTPRRDVR